MRAFRKRGESVEKGLGKTMIKYQYLIYLLFLFPFFFNLTKNFFCIINQELNNIF